MPFDKESAKKILAQIDRDELAQLGCDLTSIASHTGQEKAVHLALVRNEWIEAGASGRRS